MFTIILIAIICVIAITVLFVMNRSEEKPINKSIDIFQEFDNGEENNHFDEVNDKNSPTSDVNVQDKNPYRNVLYSPENDAYEDKKFNAGRDSNIQNEQLSLLFNSGDADDRMVSHLLRSTRDKRVIDAQMCKTPDYYAHHFDDELQEAEDRVWWGTYEK